MKQPLATSAALALVCAIAVGGCATGNPATVGHSNQRSGALNSAGSQPISGGTEPNPRDANREKMLEEQVGGPERAAALKGKVTASTKELQADSLTATTPGQKRALADRFAGKMLGLAMQERDATKQRGESKLEAFAQNLLKLKIGSATREDALATLGSPQTKKVEDGAEFWMYTISTGFEVAACNLGFQNGKLVGARMTKNAIQGGSVVTETVYSQGKIPASNQ